MITKFSFEPFVGAAPIMFGMSMCEVEEKLSKPNEISERSIGGLKAMHVNGDAVCAICYNEVGQVVEITYSAGMSLAFHGKDLLSNRNSVAFLLQYDPKPQQAVGIVLFQELGLSMSKGFVSKSADKWRQRSISCMSREQLSMLVNAVTFEPYP